MALALARACAAVMPWTVRLRPLVSACNVGIQTRWLGGSAEWSVDMLVVHPRVQPVHHLQEALRLAESLTGGHCPHICVGPSKQLRPAPATFFGRGTVDLVRQQAQAQGAQRIFLNAKLSGVQQRNLEAAWGAPVLDRVALILGIFAQRARTHEARLQARALVELAELDYKASRLVRTADPTTGKRRGFGLGGEVEVVSARERGRSGSGSGGLGGAAGGGESELQLQQRRIGERRKVLLRRLEEVRRTRAVQRAARRRSGKPQVAVVGYTNAGKSSLVTALTGSEVGAADALFATLDPTLRRARLPSGREAVLSDTVGFISDLPVSLVAAFRATLEEVVEADVLLHVLDASSPHVLEQRAAVLRVLRELGVSQQRLREGVIEVWNKADLLRAEAEESGTEGSTQAAAAPLAADGGADAGKAAAATAAGEEDGWERWQEDAAGECRAVAEPAATRSSLAATLASDAAYRPAAVVTSVAQREGLAQLLKEIDCKVDWVLARGSNARGASSSDGGGPSIAEEEAQLERHLAARQAAAIAGRKRRRRAG
eukprot:scaffold29.g5965.t1